MSPRPRSLAPLTRRQEQLLTFLREYGQRHGRPPTYRECCEAMDVVSTNAVHCVLKSLESKGRVRRRLGGRGWELAEFGATQPAAQLRAALVEALAALRAGQLQSAEWHLVRALEGKCT